MRLYSAGGGQLGGNGNLSPASILSITALFRTPWNGFMPYVSISHIHTALHTHRHTPMLQAISVTLFSHHVIHTNQQYRITIQENLKQLTI